MLVILRTLLLPSKKALVFSRQFKSSSQTLKSVCQYRPRQLKISLGHDIDKNKIEILKTKFHTTPQLNISPLVALLVRPLTRIGAFVFGRLFKRWWTRRTPEEKEKYRKWFNQRRQEIYGALGIFLAGLFTYYVLHIEIDPLTGRSRLILLNGEQQKALGRLAFDEHLAVHQESIVPANHPAYIRLLKITDRLLKANNDLPQVTSRQWTLTVVNSPDKNAYVLPGGNIFVFLGALKITENDDQLASILAHEMAHVLLLHPIEQVSRNVLVDILLVIPIAVVWALFPDLLAFFLQIFGINMANILLTLPYSRKLENEADDVGIKLAARACFDVREAVVFWGIMRTLTELHVEPADIPFFSTHPNHEDREKNISAKLKDVLALRAKSGCPKLSARDPIKFFNALSIEDRAARLKVRGVL